MRTIIFSSSHAVRLTACLAAMLLSGCALGPKGIAPAMPQPAHYGVQATPEETGPPDALQHFSLGKRAVPQWWRAYGSDTLSAWVDEALRQNYSLSQASHNLVAAHEQLRAQVGETMLPSVDAVGQSSRQRALGLPGVGSQTNLYNVFAGEIDASYTFDLFGVARFANSALAAQVDAQSYQLDAARRTVAANLVIAAINAAALHAQIDATERLILLTDTDTKETQRRYQLGAVSRDDLLNAQAGADTLRATLPALRTQWQAARHAVSVLMGRSPDAAPDDLDLAALHLPDPIPVAIPSDLLKQRPDILAADAALKVAAAEEAVATAQLFPSLSISASFGQAGFTWPTATAASGAVWSMGASLTQPLFHGGALLAKRRAAQQAYLAAEDNYRQTVLNAFQNVADSLGALTHDGDTLAATSAARRHSEQYWRDVARRAALGAVAPSAARDSEKQYQNARLNDIRATGLRLTDTAALFQAMGIPFADEHNAAKSADAPTANESLRPL